MNVLNKFKSKRTKQTQSVQNNSIQTQKVEIQQIQQPPISEKNGQFEAQIYRTDSISSREIIPTYREQDFDEDNFSQYRFKKNQKQKMIERFGNDEGEIDKKWKNGGYCLMVKKNYIIGDICVLEGELLFGNKSQIQTKRRVKLSCSVETIPLSDSIAKVLLSRVVFLNEREGIFTAVDIIKILQKGFVNKQ